MKTGVILLNFGEPADSRHDAVVDYLARIFFANANLEDAKTDEERWARSRELAERRAPGLVKEYEEIGGSPLNAQADAQAKMLSTELKARNLATSVYSAMQYTPPFIADVFNGIRDEGIERLVALPVYPLCGRSTNVMALEELRNSIDEAGWDIELHEITGWHKHPTYNRLRAENIAQFCNQHNLNLKDASTKLINSAHGTPQRYIDEGSRYAIYVEEYCDAISALLGGVEHELGYQNHSNRNIEWTQPEIEEVVKNTSASKIVLEPVSFMHEQSETLAELDHELREIAEEAGKEFFRVPIPHDHPKIAGVMADLVEPFITGIEPAYYQFRQCRCKPTPGTYCLNAPRS